MKVISLKKDYFALSFSDYQVRLAQVNRRGTPRSLVGKKITPGIIERGEIKDKKALGLVLIDLFKAAKLKDKFVVVGLPEVRAFTRTFNLPNLTTEELDDAVRWESESLLPFPLKEAYLDWMILEKTENKNRVLVVALPKSLVEDYAQLLEKLGYQPVAFEITSLSLARLARKISGATLMIEVKEKEAILVIIGAKGGIEVSSTIKFDSEAEAFQEILSTVNRILSFYKKKVGESKDQQKVGKSKDQQKIGRVVLCGKGVKEGLVKGIQKEIGIPSSILKTSRPELASLISLARKDVAAPIDERTINLIPPRIQGLYDRAAKVREISFLLKASLSVLFLILFGYSVTFAHLYFEDKKIERRTIELQAAIIPEIKKTEEKVQFLNKRAKEIVDLGGTKTKAISLLPLVIKSAPEGVSVTRFTYTEDKNEILVSGLASFRKDLLTFEKNLEKTEEFYQIQIPLSSLEEEEDVSFTISLVNEKGSLNK